MTPCDPITDALASGVHDGVFPGAVLLVRHQGRVRSHQAVGVTSHGVHGCPVTTSTIYDLASLTKPLATATAVLRLAQEGALRLEQPMESVLAGARSTPVGCATIEDLLCHRSGLPAWRPYYQAVPCVHGVIPPDRRDHGFQEEMLALVTCEPFEYAPRTQSVYSDLGYMLLGWMIEAVSQTSFKAFCMERIFRPLAAAPLAFVDAGGSENAATTLGGEIAPTEDDGWRQRLLQGEVHDENAAVLAGSAGHAGMFGTAEAVGAITRAWLEGYYGRDEWLSQPWVRRFVARQPVPDGTSWALGWDTPSTPSSSGSCFSLSSFGHLGFTGTSIWIDPVAELEVILLTNRVHPTRANTKIRTFRPYLHDIVYQTYVGSASA